jgi:hypothetical protein
MHNSNADERDKMFSAFRNFYLRSVKVASPAFLSAMNKYSHDYEQWWMKSPPTDSLREFLRERPVIAKAGSAWVNCGFSMSDCEGNLLPTTDSSTLLEFADRLGSSLASYIRFRGEEDREIIMDDQSLVG